MSIQLCDYSAYAVILAPSDHGELRASLYHWRHFEFAQDSTGVQLLHERHIEPYTGPIDPPIKSWAATHLAPALDAISPMVPKSASVLVCLWENTPIQDGDLRLEIQKCCEGFGSDPRGVKFHLGKRAGPFEKFLSDSDSTVPTDPADTTRSDSATAVDTYVAIYTVKPMNVVRIYHRDAESTVTMVREEFLNDEIDITEPEADLEQSVIRWVTNSLRQALDLNLSSKVRIELYLPTEDLRANRQNDYNSVRDQIMRSLELRPIGMATIVLAGSSDPESPNGILDPLLDDIKSKFRTSVKYSATIEYGSDFMDIVLERWDGSKGEVLGKPIKIIAAVDEEDSTTKKNINAALGKAIAARDDDGGKNAIPLVILLSAQDDLDNRRRPLNSNVIARMRNIMGALSQSRTSIQYETYEIAAVRIRVPGGGDYGAKEGAAYLFKEYPRCVVVVDAGSSGTRAVLYRWLRRDSGPMTVFNRKGDAPFRHSWLPYIKYCGEVDVNGGIHRLEAANANAARLAVEGYLEPLRERLDSLLQRARITPATTPMFMLATGGMRNMQNVELRGWIEQGIRASHFYLSFPANMREFSVATGPQEALYGWMTSNYSLARLEPRVWSGGQVPTTYGFVEMGGQSVQIAYEIAGQVAAPAKVLRIVWKGKEREFKVFTKVIENLGAQAARAKYLTELQGNQDPCSLLGQDFPAPNAARQGTGLCVGAITPAHNGPTCLATSMLPVFQLRCNHYCTPAARLENCPTRLLLDAPPIDYAAGYRRFVAGSSFWYATRAIYTGPMRQEHSFRVRDIRRMIIDFAIRPWAAHRQQMVNEVTAEVQAIRPRLSVARAGELRIAKIAKAERFLRDALFNAILVYTTLYDGVGIPPGTTTPVVNLDGTFNIGNGVRGVDAFHPFNGVVGQHNDSNTKIVPYSWTLGRALYYAVGATGA